MNPYLITLLALCMWREARGEKPDPLLAMRCVGHVVRNRVLKWKKDWDEAIAGRNQFSSISVKGDSQTVEWPDDDNVLFRQTFELAGKILEGVDEDPTMGALYYGNLKYVTSEWFKKEIVARPDVHPVMLTQGQHVFYA